MLRGRLTNGLRGSKLEVKKMRMIGGSYAACLKHLDRECNSPQQMALFVPSASR